MRPNPLKALLLGAALLAASGCGSLSRGAPMTLKPVALCDLAQVDGSGASGRASFTVMEGVTRIEITMRGLKPGKHGIHVHEHGDCGDSAKSAGAHFNPALHRHGPAADWESHRGDLGNIVADSQGRASLVLDDKFLPLDGMASMLGRSIVVHADPDDLESQPAGNSGARIACGRVYAADERP